MSLKNFFIWIIVTCSYVSLNAQNTEKQYCRWQLTPALGYSYSHADLRLGEITDNLVQYDFNTLYYQVISGAYFPFNHFGAELLLQTAYSNDDINYNATFTNELEALYGKNYFITSSTGNKMGGVALAEGNAYRYIFGLIYRTEKDKFQYQLKFRVIQQALFTNTAQVRLKQKGTNTILNLEYDFENNSSGISIGPDIVIGYRISKYLILTADVAYYYSKPAFTYTETIANPLSGETSINKYPYEENVNLLTAGLGLTIELGRSRPFSLKRK